MSELLPKQGIMDITPYQGGKSKADGAERVIKLSSNESAVGASPRAMTAYVRVATQLARYPDGGFAALKEAIAEVYSLPEQQIVCGAGSDELIHLLIHAYAGPGDEVLYSEHGFLMYKIYALSCGATPVTAPEKELTSDVDALLAAANARTKFVFLANPNNPTGSYVSGSELERLRDGLPDSTILVIDAAYAEYAEADDYSNGLELVKSHNNVVMLRTFSKIYGLASLRIGWCFAPEGIVDVLHRVRSPFNVNGPAIAAGVEAVKDVEFTEAAQAYNSKWKAWLENEYSKLGLRVYPSEGNFLLVQFEQSGKHTAVAANDFLMGRGIIPRMVGNYGLPDCLRITVGLEDENRALIDALQQFMSRG